MPPVAAAERREVPTPRGPLESLLYRPNSPPLGAYVVVPGLHPQGPDDPRLDRFCRVLAAAGFLVCAPLLPDYLALRLTDDVSRDLQAAWDAFEPEALALGLPPPALFSVSFGSLPALSLASSESHRGRVGAVVVFGGFADFPDTARFAISGRMPARHGRAEAPSDPLNPPALFINLLPFLDAGEHAAPLERAWRTMVLRTWGKFELKRPGALAPIAHEVASSLPQAARPLFLIGCGLVPGGTELVELGLERAAGALAFADPRPLMAGLRAPVVLVHGSDDDVIPWTELRRLEAALPPGLPRRVFLTGLYGHTGAERPEPSALYREARTMLGLVWALVSAPTGVL
jgi:pimeloyl-ACP methyl ester carboxylesterase